MDAETGRPEFARSVSGPKSASPGGLQRGRKRQGSGEFRQPRIAVGMCIEPNPVLVGFVPYPRVVLGLASFRRPLRGGEAAAREGLRPARRRSAPLGVRRTRLRGSADSRAFAHRARLDAPTGRGMARILDDAFLGEPGNPDPRRRNRWRGNGVTFRARQPWREWALEGE